MGIRGEIETRGIQIGKEVKLSLFADNMILHMENSKDTTIKLIELIRKSGKVAGSQSQYTETPCFPIHQQ